MPAASPSFAARVVRWQRAHGRNDLPWQADRDPYRVWLSEVMLQQTQVASVIPYYERFLVRFPDVRSLALAAEDDVLRAWAGLGYYSRARNLHRAAVIVVRDHGGSFPDTRAALEQLPGLGRSTAAAVAAFAFGRREAILDGNVKRLLARHFAVSGYPGEPKVAARLWQIAEDLLPTRDIERYTQGLMDLGATVCARTADCGACPLRATCQAAALGRVTSFPTPMPRKQRPVRATTMLMLVHAGEVLLEKRPSSGIWGGLWSLPEMPVEVDVTAYCAEKLGCALATSADWAQLRHEFTHFSLDIRTLKCDVSKFLSAVREPRLLWVDLEEACDAAVPAPVKQLLLQLAGNTEVRAKRVPGRRRRKSGVGTGAA